MATNTYVALDTVVVSGSSTNTIQFVNIPSGYSDLVIVANLRSSDSRSGYQSVSYTFNSVGSSQYSGTILYGNGSNALSYRQPNESVFEGLTIMNGSTSNIFYTNILNIMNYSNTTTYKTVLMEMGNAGLGSYKQVATWRNTSAITTVEIKEPSNLPWLAGSSATIYGIKAAAVSVAKATGGTIYYGADGYVYHKFTGNGTFTPTQSISADVLVVAGGGGGGRTVGGGGGAGGLLAFASQALTATGYSVTVGSGGAGGTDFSSFASNGADSQFGALTLVKGGGGGGGGDGINGVLGGSGGGGGGAGFGNGGAGTSGQGFAGDNGGPDAQVAGGGGGAGAAATNKNGAVGSSAYSTWGIVTSSGENVSGTYYYAGGGGAGTNSGAGGEATVAGAGGYGGGASGRVLASLGVPAAATANTGGGGGGSGGNGNSSNGGNGGSGIVIIRYAG